MMRAIALVFLAFWLALSPVRADEPILIRFSHVVGEKTPKGMGANLLKSRIEERFPGRVRVEVYPESRHFTDEEVLVALVLGDVELAAPSFTQFRRFTPKMQVFELPFLFRDVDHIHRFQASPAGQSLLDEMRPRGLQGLAYWDNGMRAISANRPLRTPDDAEGLLFRIEPSIIFQIQYRAVGVTTIPMPFRQMPDAIRSGLVQGQENSWSNIYSRGVHQLHRSFTELNHSFLGYVLVTSTAFWQKLPPDVRPAIEEIVAQVTDAVNRQAADDATRDRARALAGSDAEVLSLTPEDLDLWRQRWTALWPRFADDIGKPLIEAAVAAGRP
jgi:C4-dicarboxylate-binding protein DctP